MEVSFYDVAEGNLISTLVRLMEKIFEAKQKCVFFSPIPERVEAVDRALWTFSTNAFVPHGGKEFGFAEYQPIYFTASQENPNGASTLVVVDSFDYEWFGEGDSKKIIFAFEGDEQRKKAKKIHEDLKKNSANVNYWKQSGKGWDNVQQFPSDC